MVVLIAIAAILGLFAFVWLFDGSHDAYWAMQKRRADGDSRPADRPDDEETVGLLVGSLLFIGGVVLLAIVLSF